MDFICLTPSSTGAILCMFYILCGLSLSAFSSLSPACEENSRNKTTLEVLEGNDVNITFTLPKQLESGENFFWMKENVELGWCLANGDCHSYDGDHDEFKANGTTFSIFINMLEGNDTGDYTYKIIMIDDKREENVIKNCNRVVSLVVHKIYPTCRSVYLKRSHKLQFSCDVTHDALDWEARLLYGDEYTSKISARNKSQITMTFHELLSGVKAPDMCSVSKYNLEKQCNFSVFLDPKEDRLVLNKDTEALTFKCCTNEEHAPDAYIMENQSILNKLELISGDNHFDINSTCYEHDFRELEFVIVCGRGESSKIVTNGIAKLSFKTPASSDFSISANVTKADSDIVAEALQSSCKRKYNITITVQLINGNKPIYEIDLNTTDMITTRKTIRMTDEQQKQLPESTSTRPPTTSQLINVTDELASQAEHQFAECGHCDCKIDPMLTAICVLSSIAFLASIRTCFIKLYHWQLNSNFHQKSRQHHSKKYQDKIGQCNINREEKVEEEPSEGVTKDDETRTGKATDQDEAVGASNAEGDTALSSADQSRRRLPLLPSRRILQAMPGFSSRKLLQQNSSHQNITMMETFPRQNNSQRVVEEEEEAQLDGNVATGAADVMYCSVYDVLNNCCHNTEVNSSNISIISVNLSSNSLHDPIAYQLGEHSLREKSGGEDNDGDIYARPPLRSLESHSCSVPFFDIGTGNMNSPVDPDRTRLDTV